MKKIGLTIGKFAPFHKGHEYLIQNALKQVEKLYILVYDTDVTDISTTSRKEWIEKIFKGENIEVIEAKRPPSQYGMDKKSVAIQVNYIVELLKKIKAEPITHFFSSEEYGKFVAKALNAENVVIDKKRVNIPICATHIRKDLEKYKQYLNIHVYNELKRYTK